MLLRFVVFSGCFIKINFGLTAIYSYVLRLLAVAFPLGRITGREVIPKHKCKHLRYSCVLHFDRAGAVKERGKGVRLYRERRGGVWGNLRLCAWS